MTKRRTKKQLARAQHARALRRSYDQRDLKAPDDMFSVEYRNDQALKAYRRTIQQDVDLQVENAPTYNEWEWDL